MLERFFENCDVGAFLVSEVYSGLFEPVDKGTSFSIHSYGANFEHCTEALVLVAHRYDMTLTTRVFDLRPDP